MSVELKSMTRKQLEKHLEDVKKALVSAQARDRRQAKKAAEKAAAEFGFSLGELNDAEKPRKERKTAKKPAKPSKAKYVNPDDKTKTWTGKGRQPNWYREQIEKGASPESMEI